MNTSVDFFPKYRIKVFENALKIYMYIERDIPKSPSNFHLITEQGNCQDFHS